jgi:FlaA1/EpsC-like NDP-sugar epimerase
LKAVKLPSHSYSSKLANAVLGLPRLLKRAFVFVVDVILCVAAAYFAFYLRLGYWVSSDTPTYLDALLLASACSLIIALPIFVAAGLYRMIFRYSGLPALLAVTKAVGIYAALYFLVFTLLGIDSVPRTIGLIQPILLLLLVGASRAIANVWLGGSYSGILKKNNIKKVLIYGAGSAGRQLAGAIAGSHDMRVMGFIDDDLNLQGHVINGLRVHKPDQLGRLISIHTINDILLALPSLSRVRRNAILQILSHTKVKIRTLPSMTDLAQGRVSIADVRELDVDDLLGREPVMPNHILLAKNVHKKVVMVTGAGGSIGSELCRQIAMIGPAKLLLIEQSEFALYTIHKELEEKLKIMDIALVPLLASAQDADRMREIISTWHPDTIYHAAAYKHVPLVEHNPAAGIKNNLLGTLHTAQAAAENGVTDFVLISTDKAVRPTNVMGASKRLAEMVLQALAADVNYAATKFSMVRFGNVLDSSGSVVPKFRQQIRDGESITLTHPEVTRYFMTIPEAAQLVIQAGAMAKGGDVFMLDMGQPVKIMDLARRMIELSGLIVRDEQNPDGDVEIEITGLRPGEKLYEELLIGDNPQSTLHPRIMRAQEEFISWSEFEHKLKSLEIALNVNDVGVIRLMLQQLVAGYLPSDAIMDWIYLEQEADFRSPQVQS